MLDEQQATLTLTGTSDALTTSPGTAVTVVFTVTADLGLAATWTAVPPDAWTLGYAFPGLAETSLDYLPVSGARFAATTVEHADPAYFFPLRPGLQYQATIAVRDNLTVPTGEPGQAGTFYTPIGGPVEITADGLPRFTWTAQSALGPLTIARVGQDPLVLDGGQPQLSCTDTGNTPARRLSFFRAAGAGGGSSTSRGA